MVSSRLWRRLRPKPVGVIPDSQWYRQGGRSCPGQLSDQGSAPRRCSLWANGSRCDFSWIDAPVFTGGREPKHARGITGVPGLYFLGLPWLHKWKSAFLFGVGEDAEHLAMQIAAERHV